MKWVNIGFLWYQPFDAGYAQRGRRSMRVAPPGFRAPGRYGKSGRVGRHRRNRQGMMTDTTQQLFLVYGGALLDPTSDVYAEPGTLDVCGIFDSYEAAYEAWQRASFRSVDDALVRYRIVPLF